MIRDERGLSLTELLVALAVAGVITSVLVTAIYQIFDITGRGNDELVVQHDLQNAATWLHRDVLTACRATIAGSEETGIYTMTLEVPYLNIHNGEVSYSYIAYTYSEETEALTRDDGGLSLIIARHLTVEPFPPVGVFLAPQSVMVTLRSREGNVPGSGTFALKMRAGGSMTAQHLCGVTGVDSLGFGSDAVTWVITNTGSTSPSIDEIYILWPSENEVLDMISFGEDLIHYQRHEPISDTISEPWLGSFASRKIISGTQKTIEFGFDSDDPPIANQGQYSITITLTDNCTFSFPP